MGILDDAIREHLDLKRRLGAEDTELARLEDEAFGLPTRPGDPDFPEDTAASGTAVAELVTGEAQPTAPTEAPEEHVVEPSPGQDAAPAEPSSEELAAESAPPATAEEAAVDERDSGGFYDHAGDELDLELDLDLDDAPAEPPPAAEPPSEELSAVPETADQPAVDPTPTPPPVSEPPIESLDTVEHDFGGAIEDTGEAEVVEGELADEPDAPAAAEGEDEDVLEETPEFLRDAPEDDELWFEQGEPKDFDF